MRQSMTFRQWLAKLFRVDAKDQALRDELQRARDSLLCEIEQITRSMRKDGKPH